MGDDAISPLHGDANEFYNNEASSYEILSRDRDFYVQCEKIIGITAVNNPRLLELFAGPAYHSEVLQRKFGATVICIDASEEMRGIAIERHSISPEHYVCGRLPDALDSIPNSASFDGALLLRYSIGYLPLSGFEHLLRQLKRLVRLGGVIFLELHLLNSAIRNFADLDIKYRVVPGPNYTATVCEWPAGPIAWGDADFEMDMTIRIEAVNEYSRQISLYTSRERLYSRAEIEYIAGVVGGYSIVALSDDFLAAFPGSSLICLRREDGE